VGFESMTSTGLLANSTVQFLNIFLFQACPEGLGRKNFKIWTQSFV
jgi:hypothetical protein